LIQRSLVPSSARIVKTPIGLGESSLFFLIARSELLLIILPSSDSTIGDAALQSPSIGGLDSQLRVRFAPLHWSYILPYQLIPCSSPLHPRYVTVGERKDPRSDLLAFFALGSSADLSERLPPSSRSSVGAVGSKEQSRSLRRLEVRSTTRGVRLRNGSCLAAKNSRLTCVQVLSGVPSFLSYPSRSSSLVYMPT
jgi:hypothetical protein